MTTRTAGIREIDTGGLPDRYARGWHCLGPVTDYRTARPKGMDEAMTIEAVQDVHRRRQQGLPSGRRHLEAQDTHRQPTACRRGWRRLSDAPVVSAVLC